MKTTKSPPFLPFYGEKYLKIIFSAESLKEEYVGRGNGTLFNMFKNKKTGQIVLKGIRIAAEIATDYYLNTKK